MATLTNLGEFSRCDDQSWQTVEEQNLHREADRADATIAEKVGNALWNYRKVDVDVKAGMVTLSGSVISTTSQQQVEDAARKVPGVLGIKSYLVSDDKLIRDVAGSLGKIEHEYGVKFFTGVQNGVVVLNGEVNSVDVRSLAEKCAASIPGVRGVINSVRAPGVDLQEEDQRFLQPSIGGQIFFRDGLCATIHSVIINPNSRRVVAMVVRGRFTTSPQDPRFLVYGETSSPERLVVIPAGAIRLLTKDSGFLHLDSTQVTESSDFNPSCFIAPREDWTPPYPYCPDHVLFPVESLEEITQTEIEPAFMPAIFPWTNPVIRSEHLK